MRARVLPSVVVVAAAVVGACGGHDPPASSDAATATSAIVSPASTAAGTGDRPGVAPEGYTVVTIVITDVDGNTHEYCVWLADTVDERSNGLMKVTDLGGAKGMLFAYDDPTDSRFYMFNTPTPLSIAFFDADGAFVSETDMEPCLDTSSGECPRYPAERQFTHALEVPQGQLPALGVAIGSRLDVVDGSEQASCPVL